mgnify:FL=1
MFPNLTKLHRPARSLDSLFNHFFAPLHDRSCHSTTFPALNAWEDDDAYQIEVEVPGMSREDLKLELLEGTLSIKGERKDEPEDGDSIKRHRRGRFQGEFERKLQMPEDIDGEKLSARLEHGLLTIELPKSDPVLPRQIEIA